MKNVLLIFIILTSAPVQAQFIKERAVDVSIGVGFSAPFDDYDVIGTGFFAQGEYVLVVNKWFDLRPYAGMIFAKVDKSDTQTYEAGYRSTANAFLFGGKFRLTAPIPWIAPYVEGGLGASAGSFQTLTPFTQIEDSGLFFHIPFSLGLELGPGHNVNIEFTYYFHNGVKQFAGAAALGLAIPLK